MSPVADSLSCGALSTGGNTALFDAWRGRHEKREGRPAGSMSPEAFSCCGDRCYTRQHTYHAYWGNAASVTLYTELLDIICSLLHAFVKHILAVHTLAIILIYMYMCEKQRSKSHCPRKMTLRVFFCLIETSCRSDI